MRELAVVLPLSHALQIVNLTTSVNVVPIFQPLPRQRARRARRAQTLQISGIHASQLPSPNLQSPPPVLKALNVTPLLQSRGRFRPAESFVMELTAMLQQD